MRRSVLLGLTSLLLITGCGTDKGKIFNVKTLAGKTEFEVSELMGKPDTTFTWSFIGRKYRINRFRRYQTEVRYLNGQACEIILHNPEGIPFDPSSLERFGLPKATPNFMDASSTIQWKNLDGIKSINFYKVGRKGGGNTDLPTYEIYFNLH